MPDGVYAAIGENPATLSNEANVAIRARHRILSVCFSLLTRTQVDQTSSSLHAFHKFRAAATPIYNDPAVRGCDAVQICRHRPIKQSGQKDSKAGCVIYQSLPRENDSLRCRRAIRSESAIVDLHLPPIACLR